MKRISCFIIACVFGIAPAFASEETGEVVARLGETQWNAAALSPFIRSLDPALRKQALSEPDLMNRLVGLELARVAVLNEAAAQKWQDRPEVARRIERAKGDAIFSSYMASVAAIPKGYPPDADIASAYELNRDAYMGPRRYRLEQIFVSALANTGKSAAAAAEMKAQELARMAKAMIVNFSQLARIRSDHKPSAEKGGDLGWATETQILDEIRAAVPGMAIGDVSEPIRTAAGWHIVRLADTTTAGPKPLAEVKDQIAAMLRQKKLRESQESYIARLLAQTPIAVNEAGLKKLFEFAP